MYLTGSAASSNPEGYATQSCRRDEDWFFVLTNKFVRLFEDSDSKGAFGFVGVNIDFGMRVYQTLTGIFVSDNKRIGLAIGIRY